MDLEVCPFCGGKDCELQAATTKGKRIKIDPYFYVECHDCAAQGPAREDKFEAVADWNWVSRIHLY